MLREVATQTEENPDQIVRRVLGPVRINRLTPSVPMRLLSEPEVIYVAAKKYNTV